MLPDFFHYVYIIPKNIGNYMYILVKVDSKLSLDVVQLVAMFNISFFATVLCEVWSQTPTQYIAPTKSTFT